jgi:hypothetical protein
MRRTTKQSRPLAEALASRYWSEREAGAVLAAWQRSGESATAFARRQGLVPSRLLRWEARLSGKRGEGQPHFHPVEVVPTRSTAHPAEVEPAFEGQLELIVGSSRRIVVRRGFDPELLWDLVRVLEAGPC